MEDFANARMKMVDSQIRTSGITDVRLIAALGDVAREIFVPEARQALAYADTDHALGVGGRVLPAVTLVAKLIQLANIKSDDVVLDVGCGTGYSTAIIAALAGAVVGVENESTLVERANGALSTLNVGNAVVVEGNVAAGVPAEAPFDVIVVAGVVDSVPAALFAQLREGGRLVTMIDGGVTATAQLYVKSSNAVSERAQFDGLLPRIAAFQTEPAFAL